MHSKLLKKHGLMNYVAGSDYNFRYKTAGKSITDDVESVLSTLGIAPDEIYTGQQKHTANIAYADGSNGEPFIYGKTFKDTDGLITNKRNLALLIKFADCTPVVIYDPVQKVQASVHSGWRGTTKRIALRAIEKMEKECHCKRENMLVYLGPSIDQGHYEVGKEVYDAFETFGDRDSFFKERGKKYLLSMLDANLSIIKEAGILDSNIEVERASTYIDASLHSARKEGSNYQLNSLLTMMM